MKIASYMSKSKSLLTVLIPQGASLDALPSSVQELGPFEHWKDFELDSSKPRIGLDTEKAIEDVTKNGYHISQASIGKQA